MTGGVSAQGHATDSTLRKETPKDSKGYAQWAPGIKHLPDYKGWVMSGKITGITLALGL
jgi:hypothetical protein